MLKVLGNADNKKIEEKQEEIVLTYESVHEYEMSVEDVAEFFRRNVYKGKDRHCFPYEYIDELSEYLRNVFTMPELGKPSIYFKAQRHHNDTPLKDLEKYLLCDLGSRDIQKLIYGHVLFNVGGGVDRTDCLLYIAYDIEQLRIK